MEVSRRPFATLQRLARARRQRAEATRERCELCGEPIPREHRHMLEVAAGEIRCACQACSILFDQEAASSGKYRLVPDRRTRLTAFEMNDGRWASLRIPVGIAYFVHSTPAGRVMAYYPSPMGAAEAPLEPGAWEEIEGENPALREMRPDVEALLVNRARGALHYFLVPIDDCYRLVALLRMHWKGLSGGHELWAQIEGYFEALAARAERI